MTGEPQPLAPGSTIGILGGGQLGRMLALAAARLGFKCHIYAPAGDTPAFDVAHSHSCAGYDDERALAAFAAAVDVVTYEFENVPLETAARLARHAPLYPPAKALKVSQDRVAEKSFLGDIGLKTADWLHDDDIEAVVAQAAGEFDGKGRRGIVKTCRLGYDGKGQVRVTDVAGLREAWQALAGSALILEWEVPFRCEVSVIAARSRTGEVRCFDIAENRHENGILRSSTVPARIRPQTAAAAHGIAERLLANLDYCGVVGVELFVVDSDAGEQLVVNEFAPRVHNSGHWTEAACTVSQFEQHIRAIAGWPLGNPARHSDAVMENLLGSEIDAVPELAGQDRTMVHVYGKREARDGRKMGHFTRLTR